MKICLLSHRLRRTAGGTALFFLNACASSTMIQSQPSGAKLYLNGEPVGTTPYTMTDTKIVGSTTTVRLEYPGYESTTGLISRNEEFDVGACIGGVLLLVPLLWIQKYKPTHTFELRPAGAAASAWAAPPAVAPPSPATPPPAARPHPSHGHPAPPPAPAEPPKQ